VYFSAFMTAIMGLVVSAAGSVVPSLAFPLKDDLK
jgi:hypothetical protein